MIEHELNFTFQPKQRDPDEAIPLPLMEPILIEGFSLDLSCPNPSISGRIVRDLEPMRKLTSIVLVFPNGTRVPIEPNSRLAPYRKFRVGGERIVLRPENGVVIELVSEDTPGAEVEATVRVLGDPVKTGAPA